MKKFMSCILVITMMVALSAPVFAESVISTDSLCFTYNGHGEFVATPGNVIMIKNQKIDTLQVGNKISAVPTVDKEIYAINNSDKFLVACSGDKYLLSDKIDVDTQNFENNIENFEKYGVSERLKNDMQSVIEEQTAIGNNNFTIEVYAPALNEATGEVSVMADEPLGTRYYTYYYDGMYHNMKDYSVKYSNLSTGMIKKEGTATLNTAKNFVSFIVSSAGGVSEVVNAFGTYLGVVMSAYDLYKSLFGEVISGTANDYISTNLIYARIVKDTYAQDPVYLDYPNIGCVTHKVWLSHNETYHFYHSKGRGELTSTELNKEIYTENFRDPAPYAIDNGISATHFDFPLMTTIYGKLVRLVGDY